MLYILSMLCMYVCVYLGGISVCINTMDEICDRLRKGMLLCQTLLFLKH